LVDRGDGGPTGALIVLHRRALPVGLERFYENALDWERLSHLHGDRIAAVVCCRMDATHWRALVTTADGAEHLVELVVDRRQRCVRARVIDGAAAGWHSRACAHPRAPEELEIVVEVFAPAHCALDPMARRRWASTVARFWDADAAMMQERQRQIDRRIDGVGPVARERDLGSRASLVLPLPFEVGGREYVLAEVDGELVAYPRRCPHMLGPLTATAPAERILTCPWHGYRFDAATGENLSGGTCRLTQRPDVREVDGRVIAVASHR
jgi:nitrite reductase/ring-hydroxylating ferredoxin subunit